MTVHSLGSIWFEVYQTFKKPMLYLEIKKCLGRYSKSESPHHRLANKILLVAYIWKQKHRDVAQDILLVEMHLGSAPAYEQGTVECF